MQISSRFTVALHIFTCVETFKDDYKVTSDFLASSIGTNPVIIRKILTQLQILLNYMKEIKEKETVSVSTNASNPEVISVSTDNTLAFLGKVSFIND